MTDKTDEEKDIEEFEKLVEKSVSGGRFTDFDSFRYYQLRDKFLIALQEHNKTKKGLTK